MPSEQERIPIAADRIYEAASFDKSAGAEVVFTRDYGYGGSFCTWVLSINGKPAFAIRQSEFVIVPLPPGEHLLLLENDTVICPNFNTSQVTTLKRGDRQEYRISSECSRRPRTYSDKVKPALPTVC